MSPRATARPPGGAPVDQPDGPTANVAFLWGEDAYGIERAIARLAAALGGRDGPLQLWSVDGDDEASSNGPSRAARILDRIAERVATAPLFGGGTLVVVRQPGPLLREKASRARLLRITTDVPAGNGLAFTELLDGASRRLRTTDVLIEAVVAAGGLVREFGAPTRERMERFAEERAGELGFRLGPGAARLLAERVGAFVREGDVDRRRQSELANAELEKLALYRPGGSVERDDVAGLVAEAVPGSTWAFLDAVALRRAGDAARLAERLLTDGAPLPVLVAQLHRRLRELLVVGEHLATGTRPAELVRVMKLQPFRATKLSQQAGAWSAGELAKAIEGLLELDLASKGIAAGGGSRPMSDDRAALELQAWIAASVARGG